VGGGDAHASAIPLLSKVCKCCVTRFWVIERIEGNDDIVELLTQVHTVETISEGSFTAGSRTHNRLLDELVGQGAKDGHRYFVARFGPLSDLLGYWSGGCHFQGQGTWVG
jgi:hypothetical protein